MTIEIYLVRHAESEMNLIQEEIIGGRSNWAQLTPKGIEQSKHLGKYFLDKKTQFDEIYSSPAVRAQQTARYVLEELNDVHRKVRLDDNILEINQGDWEGKNRKLIYNRPDISKKFKEDNWNLIPGDNLLGESQNMVAKRVNYWIEQLYETHKNGRILAFTHGGAIRFYIADTFGYDKSTAYKIPIDNTSITILEIEVFKKPILKKFNHIPHLSSKNIYK